MGTCVVPTCNNRSDNRNWKKKIGTRNKTKITFHKFPTDPIRRRKWIEIMKLEHKNIHERSCICSVHFEEKFIDRSSLVTVRLRENAIPCLEKTRYDKIIDETGTDTKIDIKDIIIKPEDNTEQHFPFHTYSTSDKETNTPPFSLLQEKPTIEKETRVSPERLWDCPAARTIKRANYVTARNLKKKIKVLERQVKEKNKRILIMKNMLDELKADHISDED